MGFHPVVQSIYLYHFPGDIEGLKEQYKKNTEEFNKTQQMNKTRMEQGLQEKLQARRHRKKDF